jgi:RNA polymerase sigma-70 factor (sigma-E family)
MTGPVDTYLTKEVPMGGTESDKHRQLREFFAVRRDVVRRTAYLLCGDWHWADDLTQAAFMRLDASWSRIRDPGALDAYVRTCLVRAYLRETRRVWRRRERPVAELPDDRLVADPVGGADDRMTFATALRRLPPRQRAVLVCRYYQDLDVAATARALGCSPGTVMSQTARGLETLRELLGDAVDGPRMGRVT